VSRHERGTLLCQRLMTRVNEICPAGLGKQKVVWDFVAPASAAFWLALSNWEETGDEKDADILTEAYERLLKAWHDAVTRYSQNVPDGEAQ
jgi:beta-mannanase